MTLKGAWVRVPLQIGQVAPPGPLNIIQFLFYGGQSPGLSYLSSKLNILSLLIIVVGYMSRSNRDKCPEQPKNIILNIFIGA